MKNLKTIFSSALVASFAFSPAALVLAEETTATPEATSVVATTTAPVPTLYKESLEQKREELKRLTEQKREEIKRLEEQKREEIKNLRESAREDIKDLRASSTASSTARREEMKKEREDNRAERRDERMKREMASTTDRILNLTTKLGTLGTQIKAVVEAQASSSLTITSSMSQVEARSAFKTFLLGSDYKNLGKLVSEAANTKARINQIENQISKIASSTDKAALVTEVQALKDQAATLEQYIKDNQSKFSLFGWFTKRFK